MSLLDTAIGLRKNQRVTHISGTIGALFEVLDKHMHTVNAGSGCALAHKGTSNNPQRQRSSRENDTKPSLIVVCCIRFCVRCWSLLQLCCRNFVAIASIINTTISVSSCSLLALFFGHLQTLRGSRPTFPAWLGASLQSLAGCGQSSHARPTLHVMPKLSLWACWTFQTLILNHIWQIQIQCAVRAPISEPQPPKI